MARYKHYDYSQTKLLPVSYARQILPGTFEHTLSYLIDEKCDLSVFESRYKNDVTGAPAYDPSILLKIVLFAYSKGVTHSRKIEALCCENVLFMALSADTQPHFTRAGKEVQSNITDNESAKMKTDKGVMQGYTGVAIADEKHQVIIEAQAFGEGQEHGLLVPMLEGAKEDLEALGTSLSGVKLAADAGYSSEANLQYLFEASVDGYVADTHFRKRDPRFKDAERHKPTRPDEPFAKPQRDVRFQSKDFQLAEDHSHAICPAGKRLYKSGRHLDLQGLQTINFRAPIGACRECPLRSQCLRHPQRTKVRQVAFITGRVANRPEKYLEKMKRKIDSDIGRERYGRRLGIIEPVFGNIRHTKRLNRFTLRGRRKVNTQWQLYCLVHSIEKLQRYGPPWRPPPRRKRRAA